MTSRRQRTRESPKGAFGGKDDDAVLDGKMHQSGTQREQYHDHASKGIRRGKHRLLHKHKDDPFGRPLVILTRVLFLAVLTCGVAVPTSARVVHASRSFASLHW